MDERLDSLEKGKKRIEFIIENVLINEKLRLLFESNEAIKSSIDSISES